MPLAALVNPSAQTLGAAGAIALAVAFALGLAGALAVSEYAPPRVAGILGGVIDVVRGLPLVLFALFALAFLASSRGPASAVDAGALLGLLLAPHVCGGVLMSLARVPARLRAGSAGLGASTAQTLRHIVLPAAAPGILGSVLSTAARGLAEAAPLVLLAALAREGGAAGNGCWAAAADPAFVGRIGSIAALLFAAIALLRAGAVALRGPHSGMRREAA